MEVGKLSPDGYYSWDGIKWVSVEFGTKSPDGFFIWNGNQWIPIRDKINQPVVSKESIPIESIQQISEDGFWLWNGTDWVSNPAISTIPNPPQYTIAEQAEMQHGNWNINIQQTHAVPQNVMRVHQYSHQQMMMTRVNQQSWWTTNKIIALVVIIPIVLIALLVVLSGFLYVWASSIELEVTPEFGFRHDVEPSEYEDLGANRGSYSSFVQYPDFSSTVSIYGEDSNGEFWSGSGVIISEYWVLTAAHVVEDFIAEKSWVYEGVDFEDEEGYVYAISEILIHPGWEGDSVFMEYGMDIALIYLEDAIDAGRSGIAPWDNMSDSKRLEIGTLLYTSGYGGYDEGDSECTSYCLTDDMGDYSQRRAWSNILDRDIKDLKTADSFLNDDMWLGGFVVYDFDSPEGEHNSLASGKSYTLQQGDYGYLGDGSSSATPLNLEGTSVQGDSGGPTFALLDGEWTVIGLTAHGSISANYGDVSANTRVSSHALWICAQEIPNAPILGC